MPLLLLPHTLNLPPHPPAERTITTFYPHNSQYKVPALFYKNEIKALGILTPCSNPTVPE